MEEPNKCNNDERDKQRTYEYNLEANITWGGMIATSVIIFVIVSGLLFLIF